MSRFDIGQVHPDVLRAMNGVVAKSHNAAAEVGLTLELIELAKVRVSQINGCVACLGVHVPALREAGMDDRLIDIIPAWRDAEARFTPEQRAVLDLAEVLTYMDRQGERDAVVDGALTHFSREQVASLEWIIILMNTYNRISVASGHAGA